MNLPLSVLVIEDLESDAKLVVRQISKAGYEVAFTRVEDAVQMRAALAQQPWNVVLSEYNLPQFDAHAALKILQEINMDIPFIVVSGSIGQQNAVALMKAGAHDYVMKDNMDRLAPAIERELGQAEIRRQARIAESALRESEARMTGIVNSAMDAIISVNSDQKIVLFNAAAEKLFRCPAAQALGQHIDGFIPQRFRQQHRKHVEEFGRTGATVRSKGRLGTLKAMRSDGEEFPIEASISHSEVAGQKLFTVILRDISEWQKAEEILKRAEEKYRSIFENATEGIFQSSVDGRFLTANPALAFILGYESPEDLMSNLTDMGKQLYAETETHERMKGLLQERDVVVGFETQARRKDGSKIWISEDIRAVRDAVGNVLHYEGFLKDLTERRTKIELEKQLLQSQKIEAIGQLAGGVAHDFNNTLMAISGYSELMLLQLSEDHPLRRIAVEIQKSVAQGADLTRQLLAFSRKQVLTPKVMDLNKSILNMENMLRRLIGEDVDLSTVFARDLGFVKADPGQIEQVLMNLAVNARDAMSRGGKLTIETTNVELDEGYAKHHVEVSPGEYVLLAVSDTGDGMDEHVMSHIFEPFFTTKEEGKGTGLGLSTVYGIVKQSGGHISVYSQPGHGTTFKIYFPRLDGSGEGNKPAPVVPFDLTGHGEVVLLVDDNHSIRSSLAQLLELRGYKVLQAGTGVEALKVAENHVGPIQLLVSDVVMPEMSGRELSHRLTKLRPALKTLYMSGYTDYAIARHGILDPGTAFIAKPSTTQAMLIKIRELLGPK